MMATLYPAGWVQVVGMWWRPAAAGGVRGDRLSAPLTVLLVVHALLIGTVWAAAPELLRPSPPRGPWWWAAGVAVAPLLIALEYAVGYVWMASRGLRPGGLRVSGAWAGAGYGVMALTVAVAAGEEMLFRQVWMHVLAGAGLGLPPALAVTALVYALNHLHFGPLTLLQKFASGWVFGWLYAASGGSVWVPMLAHAAQNLLVLAGGRTR